MPVVATERPVLSSVLAGRSQDEDKFGIEISTSAERTTGSAATAIMGMPFVYITATTSWVPYVAQVVSATTSNASPVITQGGSARVAICVGDARGVGFNTADVTLTATAQNMTFAHKECILIEEGINWTGIADAAKILFIAQLRAQGCEFKAQRPTVAYTY